ncbi:MAG: NADH:ubiquinone reductase (Na(+)-transporting) subunit C [Bacteroidetes bacterium]|uniref:Na(+)-translocating NADH-quinone reductase subunit C n=1 Tax=Phaeocystidibacter marisrubri TaxID=1577780 RepID=A0A6L3ZH52_9FLAO|nr:NADH:ubiquinone reductase (Na(+)-transporting) subunit C [Phaeocystidibacter marisrubri]KAB2817241.1 NADH:ubiquinone reductase (Na(+)-transporting) subunit C [Phaeocystidibacter marisrubri]TNE28336.1 MAG: NADH:ubiquinone reductase (Na(+)-transporting) subunit C [Bacteroidota bacterium]GGH76286.1 Na(+)-translocating NADH-quinone reductase subunit C [Phaeocystidibacter marisrubri]
MDVNSNKYTYLFALVMVVVVALLLSGASISLKDRQDANVRQEKQQDILKSIGIMVERSEAPAEFDKFITEQVVVQNGQAVESETGAFEIDMAAAVSKPVAERQVPLYVASKNDTTFYIVPLRGKGLWGPIWGYVSLLSDGSTVYGTTFGHKGETPGLGAEITTDRFQEQFSGKQIMDGNNFVSVEVVKTGANNEHEVDGISGGTITSVGVGNMLKDCLTPYVDYFKNTNAQ